MPSDFKSETRITPSKNYCSDGVTFLISNQGRAEIPVLQFNGRSSLIANQGRASICNKQDNLHSNGGSFQISNLKER
jgi:hypothetical protein